MSRHFLSHVAGTTLLLGALACASHKTETAPRVYRSGQEGKAAKPRAYLDAQEERLARIPGTSLERSADDALVVRFDGNVLFDPGSSVLSRAANQTVQDVAEVLAHYPDSTIVVKGYTDSTGDAAENQYLSQRRAEAVGGVLVSRGVAPPRLVATGYGETQPVATNASARGRHVNRRVEIVVRAPVAR
jgi:outer membrane protein OmpA-like peptidoglycan-associated protein